MYFALCHVYLFKTVGGRQEGIIRFTRFLPKQNHRTPPSPKNNNILPGRNYGWVWNLQFSCISTVRDMIKKKLEMILYDF